MEPAEDDAEATAGTPGTPGTPGPSAYPEFARRFDVSGVTTISRRFDAAGKPEHASVVARKITVPGIRGVRPIAFEDAFDAASVQHAFAEPVAKPGATPPKLFQMVWSLTPHEQPAAGDKPQGNN